MAVEKAGKKKSDNDKSPAKKGAPACGLYIKIGPDLALEWLVKDLKELFFVVNRSEYEKNMHVVEISGDFNDQDFFEKAQFLCQIIRGAGFVCLTRGADHEKAAEMGADGILALTEEDMAAAKAALGEEAIVGLYCGLDQAKAAAAYDAGADFVSFGTKTDSPPAPDILKFWTMLTDKPALVEGHITNDYCAYYVEAGASFIDAADYIWSHGKGIMQGTVNMLHAVDLALEKMSVEQ